ncbi:MAG: hypothetical protein A3D28_02690 [Omnitrophica bacterium RIFCSPHIGHO2_02_FULL_63_14]|nr:MAG: hypothetical protein A3D28_02690 [Omnitrophica bacterium RIFCSPHIGHO2_02_FULL_63_14]
MDATLGSEGSRFQKIDKAALLSHCTLFSGLSSWELKAISRLMRLVEYRRDETVYEEGAEPGSFYVIVSGRFEVSTVSGSKRKILTYLRRGDYFGEMSLLTNDPHSATIRALSDSVLLELKKEDFKKTIEHNAAISLEISRRLTTRLRGMETRSRALMKSDIISIFSNQPKVGRTVFSLNLAASLFHETRQKTVFVPFSSDGPENPHLARARRVSLAELENLEGLGPDALNKWITPDAAGFDILNVSHERGGEPTRTVVSLLNHLAVDYRFILIDLPGMLDDTVLQALSQSDAIYFVTDSRIHNIGEMRDTLADVKRSISFPDERIFVVIHEALMGIRTTATAKREMFGSLRCYSLPAVAGLGEHEASRPIPYAVDEPEAEYSRVVRHIARRISNNLVGLALGSGAAYGLAHIGVIRALERAHIPIDIISGSSIGGLIGAVYCLHGDSALLEKTALDVNRFWKLAQMLDLHLVPLRGLFSGRLVMRHFHSTLGNKTFEDCRIPLKIVGSNLTTRRVHVFESGPLSDAVRVSISIPAIFEPVVREGEIYVDGGIMSPLPIRTLHEAGANKVIAVNVFPTPKDVWERRILLEEAREKQALAMRGRSWFLRVWSRMQGAVQRYFFANFFDILMNTIQTMETEIAEVEGEAADVLIRPVLINANWAHFFKPGEFIKRGEEEAEKLLPKIKALVSQQNT